MTGNTFTYPIILSSYKNLEECKRRYLTRRVYPSAMIAQDEFYYWTRSGEQRMCRGFKEIWVLGARYPEIVRIR